MRKTKSINTREIKHWIRLPKLQTKFHVSKYYIMRLYIEFMQTVYICNVKFKNGNKTENIALIRIIINNFN